MTDFNISKPWESTEVDVPAKEESVSSPKLVEETVLSDKEEKQPEGVITNPVKVEEVVVVKEAVLKPVSSNTNKIAVYSLRGLVINGTTIEKGYNYLTKSQYSKVENHKAVRLASQQEVDRYLN